MTKPNFTTYAHLGGLWSGLTQTDNPSIINHQQYAPPSDIVPIRGCLNIKRGFEEPTKCQHLPDICSYHSFPKHVLLEYSNFN